VIEPGSKGTLIEAAIEYLTNDIVNGEFEPEQKLSIAKLKARYGIGASPLREALSQLAPLGFVDFDSRRGFRVAAMSIEDLADITRVRILIESEALTLSIEKGDDEWDVDIAGACRRLQRLATREQSGETPTPGEIEEAHWKFHRALISACDSPRLLTLQEILYNQGQRYRSIMMRKWHAMDEVAQIHQDLADIVLSRDIERACVALREHLEQSVSMVYPRDADGTELPPLFARA
jgi:DNA-binding GntR family transcriptional regulator